MHRRATLRHGLLALRPLAAGLLVALLAACHTTPPTSAPGNVSRLPPGNSSRDGPEANPPPNLDAVPDAVPQIEPLRVGGPNKPYEIAGHTYVPLTDDRAVTEKGLASWYGKKFHGRRTASGEAYNMYAMTAAHKTLPIPSYARVRNPANGHEVIVRVNDRGPFSPNRIVDLSYTAALKLGVLGGVQTVEVTRITDDDIRTGAAFRHAPTYAGAGSPGAPAVAATATTVAVGDLDRPVTVPGAASTAPRGKPGTAAAPLLPPASTDVVATAADPSKGVSSAARALPPVGAVGTGATGSTVDLGAAAAADDVVAAGTAATTVVSESVAVGSVGVTTGGVPVTAAASSPTADAIVSPLPRSGPAASPSVASPTAPASAAPANVASPTAARPEAHDERGRAETTAGAGYWLQLGAYKQRDGALEFQRRLIDEQPWLAPLLAVFTDHGLNKLQAGPYPSRDDAKSAAERIRMALQLVPTIVEKR